MRRKSVLMIVVSVGIGVAVTGGRDAYDEALPQAALEIRLANGTEAESRTKAAVLRLVEEYEIDAWLFTRDVVIDEDAIPHSHPVLTLHTRHLGDDPALLSTLLHEQFHWLEEAREAARNAAIADFRDAYPGAPYGRPLGGRDRYSTYLHLIVCDLEYQAVTALLGRSAARSVLEGFDHYEWIYERVLDDPLVREINLRHGFDAEALR